MYILYALENLCIYRVYMYTHMLKDPCYPEQALWLELLIILW